jgi:hypothetical protein
MAPASHSDITDRCHRRTIALQLSSISAGQAQRVSQLSESSRGSPGSSHQKRFRLQICFHAKGTVFTPKAGSLEATKWGLWITGQCINEHATSDDLRRNNAAVVYTENSNPDVMVMKRAEYRV